MRQPYRGTRPAWQSGKFARVAEEVHTVYLQDKWAKMEARNQKRFIAAVGRLTDLEVMRLGTKPKEALPRRYDVELHAALKRGTVRKIFTGGNAVVWPEMFRKVGYCYEMEKDILKLKPHRKALASTLEQMFREEVISPTGETKEWEEVNAWPKCVQDFEGDFVAECYMAMFLMVRNHLGRVREAVGTTGTRY